ncbi:gastrula zinc finger protein XlCGF17.1-like [Pungitius pungitius]|uniref:gastrula zinc finger protein XlCGF17.1-like n=1 Tax=Pungitius pungitius TaxID=134920 RepID=UPI002E0E3617
MSKAQMFRYLVKQRLTEDAEEIFGLFERTIAEYEEEASRLKEDNERLKKHLHAVFNPEVRIQKADPQQLCVPREEQQEDLEPPQIKEERKDTEPRHIKEEKADMEISFTPVKSEEDEEQRQSSQLHQRQTDQMETNSDEEDWGRPETEKNLSPNGSSLPGTVEKNGGSSETEDSDDWDETTEPQSGLNSNNKAFVSGSRCSEKPLIFPECNKTFGSFKYLKRHIITHTSEKPFSCSECGKCFTTKGILKTHMRRHTGEKPFSCSECGKCFTQNAHLKTHMRWHSGEKPFRCSECGKCFTTNGSLKTHMIWHTGEKPFSCSDCGKCFTQSAHLKTHMRCHTGEKPFSCLACGKRFTEKRNLNAHMRCHCEEKAFSC